MDDYIEAIWQSNDLIKSEVNRMVLNDITAQMWGRFRLSSADRGRQVLA